MGYKIMNMKLYVCFTIKDSNNGRPWSMAHQALTDTGYTPKVEGVK